MHKKVPPDITSNDTFFFLFTENCLLLFTVHYKEIDKKPQRNKYQ